MEHKRGEERKPIKTKGADHENSLQQLRRNDIPIQHKQRGMQEMQEHDSRQKNKGTPTGKTTCHTTVKDLHSKPIEQLLSTKPYIPAYLQDLYYQRPTREEIIANMEQNLWHGETPEISAMFETKI